MGKPVTLIVVKGFEANARFNAKIEGLPDISLVVLPGATVPPIKEIEELKLGEKVADEVIAALCQKLPAPPETKKEEVKESLVFSGKDFSEAVENMEKYFLQHCWSDGFPLVPPTEDAVNRMLEGTDLPPDHLVGLVEPGGGEATTKQIAINAVMAGCLPQYLPVIIAVVEAMTGPNFDLLGLQCTTGLVSPLLIVSGPKLIEQLNINDSFSTLGPGWRANATIGRAIRLLMINIGHAWPGKPDMKAIGSPLKYVSLLAENERAYGGAWEPLRVAEGFSHDQPTVSVMPALSWQVEYLPPDTATVDGIIERLARQGKVKYDKQAHNWGMDNLVLLSPTVFDAIRRAGRSRSDIQKLLYEAIQLPCVEFFGGKEPSTEVMASRIPEWIVEKCRADTKALVPLLARPASVKVVVAGAPGPGMCVYVGTWGYGPAYFATEPIKLPQNWENLLEKYKGWETPIIK